MGQKKEIKKWLKAGVAVLLFCMIAGGIAGSVIKGYAADEDANSFFISDKDNVDSSQKITALTMSTSLQSFYVNTVAGYTLSADDISWTIDDTDIIKFRDPADGNGLHKGKYVFINAASPGKTTLTANVKRRDAQGVERNFTQTVWVTVPLKIKTNEGGMPGFKQLYVDSKQNVLIMAASNSKNTTGSAVTTGGAVANDMTTYQLESTLGTLGPKQDYATSNENVVTVSGGAIKAVGAGSAKITVTTQGTDIQTDEITVYVMPKGRIADSDDPEFNFHPKNSEPVPASGGSIDIEVDAASVDSMSNIVWIVEKFDAPGAPTNKPGQIVYDSLNGTTSDYVTGVQAVYNNVTNRAVVTISARTGIYRVRGILKDLYEGHKLEVMLTRSISDYLMYFDIEFKPNLREETYITMNVGDTYDIPGGYNIPTEDMKNYFRLLENDSFFNPQNITNYLSLDLKTGIVTALKPTVEGVTDSSYREIKLYCTTLNKEISVYIRVIDNFTLNTSEITIYTGATFTLYAIDNSASIAWSTDPENQTVISNDNGLITGLKPGVVTVIATQIDAQGVAKKARCKVTVVESPTKITLDPASCTMEVGDYKTILARIQPTSSNYLPTIRWISSDEKVIEITDSTANTAATVLAKASGISVITAINTDNIILGSCVITVEEKITSIKFPQTSITVQLSMGQMQLSPTYTPTTATSTELKWTSTNTKVATVAANGLVTLKSAGETVISVQSVSNPRVIAYCTLTVTTSLTGIYLDDDEKTIQVGETVRLTYYATPSTVKNPKVTWSVLDKSIASVKDGQVTGSKAGQTYVMIKAPSGATDMCLVTVQQSVSNIKLNTNSLVLQVGEIYYANATLTPANATDLSVVWKSKNAKVASVTKDGKITAVSAGTTTITATTANNLVADIEVTVEQPVEGVSLNYKSQTVLVGANFDLKAVIEPSKATNERVTWSSDDSSIASVSAAGTVTGVTAGTTLVTCTTVEGGYKASCVVIVKEPVTSLSINKKNKKTGIKKSFKIVATVNSDAATNSKVSWSSTNNKICRISNISADGNTVTVKTLRKGKAEIICRTTDGSKLSASCNVTVVKLVTNISLNKSYVRLLEGKNVKLKAKVKPAKATQKKVTWTSDNPDVAFVNANGKVLALKEGDATITAVTGDYKINGKKNAVCKISVYAKIPATSILTGQKDLTMIRGAKETISATVTPTDTTDSLKFISDNPRVAQVNKKTGTVTAVSTGVATITITASSGRQTTVEVSVVGLNYTNCTMEQYDTFQLKLEAGGNEANYTVSWNSSDPSVAIVNQNGLVTAKSAGTTTITAYVNGASLRCNVRVADIQ